MFIFVFMIPNDKLYFLVRPLLSFSHPSARFYY